MTEVSAMQPRSAAPAGAEGAVANDVTAPAAAERTTPAAAAASADAGAGAAGAAAAGAGAGAPLKTSLSRFVGALPKLERKHSSGDLHSRLKTRKVLGVGTTDNGDVHRSKISQVLGHNEHLYVRFPRGLLGWYLLVTCGLGLQGGLMLASPSWAAHLHVLSAQHPDSTGAALLSRAHGVTLLGLSHLLYAVYSTSDKVIIRSGFGVLVLIDACAITTQLAAFLQSAPWSRWGWLQLGLHGLSAGISLTYLNLSRNYYQGARKSPAPATPGLEPDNRKKSL